jgi:NTP pyrophosphatase (non-canonical NTP hydrolase)
MKLMILSHNDRLKQDNNKWSWADIGIKHIEESDELLEAIAEEDMRHIAEEVLDEIQVCVGILDKLEREGINIEQIFLRHNEKLVNREWKGKGVVKIQWQRNVQSVEDHIMRSTT